MRYSMGAIVALAILSYAGLSHAQYFPCTEISYFSPGCQVTQEPEQKRVEPTLDPLWSPETMSPTTPPVAVRMLKDPTPKNAIDFATWHLTRMIAMHRAQEVLEQTMASDEGIRALQRYFGPIFGEKP